MSRKTRLLNDINNKLSRLKVGTKSVRKTYQYILKKIVEDLAHTGYVPELNKITKAHIEKLIFLWQGRGNKSNTILNKLGILRKIISELPDNKELGIKKSVVKNNFTNSIPQISDPKIHDICRMQQLFGLKKYEAIRFCGYMIKDECILIPRAIAYNNLDRYVPILTNEQKEFLEYFVNSYNKADKKFLSVLYNNVLSKLKISSDVFRHNYIKSRFQILSDNYTKSQILRILRQELGYQRNAQLTKILYE